uniref:Small EDRK-rich factor-like N-terminal domain-containing protein n=1 Tax=Medicago truncatula TaxID=3880 RepID=I3S1R2_MEDTR|nr:unknown [Medicago truncatula]
MGGGNGQKAKMARERNLEKQKQAGKGSQLEKNKKSYVNSVQGVHANIYLHHIRSEVQGAC